VPARAPAAAPEAAAAHRGRSQPRRRLDRAPAGDGAQTCACSAP
jgi:hypothetical protein